MDSADVRQAVPLPPARRSLRRACASACIFAVLTVVGGRHPVAAALPPPPFRLAYILDRAWPAGAQVLPPAPIVPPTGAWEALTPARRPWEDRRG